MSMATTMRWVGRSARNRAETMGHQVKDRALQMRLDKAADENDRLRAENRTLKEAMEESRGEHERILSLLEKREDEAPAQAEAPAETEEERHSHKGRWFMLLMLVGGGAWAWIKAKSSETMEWGSRPTGGEGTETGVGSAA